MFSVSCAVGSCLQHHVNSQSRKDAETTGSVKSWEACSELCRQRAVCRIELQMKIHEDFKITEKAPIRAFVWLEVPTSAFTHKTLLRLLSA